MSGKVNFRVIFDVIETYNYIGSLIVELSTAKDLENSREFLNKFL